MRLTSMKEVEQFYEDMEGLGYNPSFSFIDLSAEIKNSKEYICMLQTKIRYTRNVVDMKIYYNYPNDFIHITFNKED